MRASHGVDAVDVQLDGNHSCSNPKCPAILHKLQESIKQLGAGINEIRAGAGIGDHPTHF